MDVVSFIVIRHNRERRPILNLRKRCMTPKARLLTEQRRRSVLDLVDQEGHVTVADMVRRFSISAVTVRNDLDALASIGAVVRSHGGAVRRLEATHEYPIRTKETLQRD